MERRAKVYYKKPGRATISRAFWRNNSRTRYIKKDLTDDELALVSSPHTDGAGMVSRQFLMLAYGTDNFPDSKGMMQEAVPGVWVAIDTADQADMGEQGSSQFFVPTSVLNMDLGNMPMNSSSTTPREPQTAAAGNDQSAGTVAPTVQQAPQGSSGTTELTANTADGGDGNDGGPVTSTVIMPPQPGSDVHTSGVPMQPSPRGATAASAGPLPNMDAAVQAEVARVLASGELQRSGFTPPGLGQPFPGLGYASQQRAPFQGGASLFASPQQGRSPQFNSPAPLQMPSFGMFTGGMPPRVQGGAAPQSSGVHAVSPGTSINSGGHPTGHNANFQQPAAQMYTAVKPQDVVLEQRFTPAATDPASFARDMRGALTVHNWDGQPVQHRVRQVLNNINADLRRLLELKGAASWSDVQLLQKLMQDYPARLSTSAKLEALKQMQCSNQENTIVFMANVITKFMEALGVDNIAQVQATLSAEHAAERFEMLASVIMNGIAPDAQAAFRLQKQAMISACVNPEGLAHLESLVVAEYSARADAAARNKRAVTFNIQQQQQGPDHSALVARVASLEAAARSNNTRGHGKTGGGGGRKTRDDWRPQFPHDPAKANRKCRHCDNGDGTWRHSVGGLGPGQHWNYKCPDAPSDNGAASDEE